METHPGVEQGEGVLTLVILLVVLTQSPGNLRAGWVFTGFAEQIVLLRIMDLQMKYHPCENTCAGFILLSL